MSIVGLGRVMNRDVARVLELMKSCLWYGGARFLQALSTDTTLLNISFFFVVVVVVVVFVFCFFVSVVKEDSDIISFAAVPRGISHYRCEYTTLMALQKAP